MKCKLLIAIALFVLAACGSDTETPAETQDASTAEDATTASDMAGGDAGESDMSVEEDMIVSDMGQDLDQQFDFGTDAARTDTGVDMSMSDAGTDAGADGACAAGYTETVGVAGEVSACILATESLNQCDASSACGTGWHVCTASEYRGRYETTEAPAVPDSTLWLAGCVRDGGAPMSPLDNVCSDCTGTQTGSDEDVGFSCLNSIRLTSDSLYVGVRAAGSCQFVGTSNSGDDAYWSAQPSSNTLNGALCCVD